jgi:hypothetical protein
VLVPLLVAFDALPKPEPHAVTAKLPVYTSGWTAYAPIASTP